MRFSTALIGVTSAVLAGTGTAFPQGEWQQPGHEEERRKDVKEFVRLELEEPLNWVPSERLMGEVLDSLIENPNTYNGEEMARITLHLCTEFYENTTATLSYIASDPTRPGQKWWYGYCFGGAPATAADFVRQPGVEHSIAYTSDIISDRVVRANQASHSQLQKRHTPDDFVPIKLEKPFNWVPTLALEARVFESIEKPEGWYVDPGTFAQDMLSLCTEDHPDDLTATFTVLKMSAVHPEGLWWTGYCIGGGPLTQADLERELGAGYSIGYTLKANDGAVKRGQPRREESERRDVKGFVRLDLQEPLNWVPGYELLTHVIGEFIADQDQFDAESFASYVLTKCTTKYPDTTATSTYLLKLPYEPDKKYWFGWCYGKDVATPDDFVRRDGVEYSIAYSSGVNSPAVKREQPGREESERRDAKGFVRLDLPEPLNWVPGEELLTYIIDQYLETRDSYDADSFALYVLTECTTKHTDATGTATWLLPLADEPATEAWFGICFGKHVPAPDDFVRREGAEYSIAYASGVNSRAVKREQAGHELGQRQDGNGRPGQEQWQRRDEHEQPGRDESLSRIKEYRRVQLEEPLNWEPGEGLIFGHNILDTYYGNDVDKYNQDSFSRWVMDNCNVDHPNTTSTFSLLTSDGFDPVNYFWEGYCFGGPPATVADYDRADDVSHSIAYTTALEDSAVKQEQPGRDERPGGHLPEDFVRVEFEDPVDPTRWIEGPALASQSLAMFYADFNDTDAESFANYVLNRCSYGYEQSVSTLTYLRIFAWADSPRVWIGHCFGGNPTSQADYQRYDWVEYTIAYTLKAKEVQPGRNLRQRQVPGQEEWQRRDASDLVRRKQEEQSGRQQQHELLADVDDFVRVKLDEPLNWTPSPDLIRTHGIGSVTEDEALYDAESFARYTLAYCARFTGCTSTASYLRSFPHVTTNKTWYGHCFWGPPTTQADYVREDWSEHSIVYTISTTPKFVRLELEEPSNWVAGPRLWPNQVLDGYQAAIDKYDTESWASYVLDRCTKEQTICTSTASYSDYIEDHKYRAWIGYCFGGGPTNQSDYVRRDGVDQSVIYTIGEKQPRREEEPEREQFQRRDLEKRQQQQGDDSWGPRNARDFPRRPDQEQRTGHEQLQSRDKGDFVRLDLEQPLDWAPGLGLFMTGVIDMTHASLDLYDQDSWAELVLNLCLQWAYCNSTISYSGFLPESPNTRVWVGLLFYGGPTKQADYERLDWVQHSVVYTIKEGQAHRRQEQQPGREQWQQRRDETERPGPQRWQRRDGYEQPGRDEWQQRDESDFKRLELDWPHNWQPGYRLWQRGILDGAEGEIPEYDEDSWAELVLGICSKHADCTSSVTYAGFYPSDPDRRVWLGYCFGGAQTTQADYERSDKVEQSVVYTRPE